jgi:hypothetical protein
MLRFRYCLAVLAIVAACRTAVCADGDDGVSATRALPSLALVLAKNGMVVTSTTGFIIASDARTSYILVPKNPLGSAASVDVLVGGNRAHPFAGRVAARAPSDLDAALVTVDQPRLPVMPQTLAGATSGEAVDLAVLLPGPRGKIQAQQARVEKVPAAGFSFTLSRGSRGSPAAVVIDAATGSVVGLALSAQPDKPARGIDLAGVRDFLVSAGVPLAPRTALR